MKWLNDPEVRLGLSLVLPLSMAEEEEWFENMLQRSPYERPLAIEIQPDPSKDKWVFVGNGGLFEIDWQNRLAEIGIHIGEKKFWDQGFGTRVMQLFVQHGFDNLNLNRIWLRVFETNPRAIRSYEKAGFIHEGKYVDVMIMSILQSEWQGN